MTVMISVQALHLTGSARRTRYFTFAGIVLCHVFPDLAEAITLQQYRYNGSFGEMQNDLAVTALTAMRDEVLSMQAST